jgi:predicted amidohydrolase
MNLTLATAQYPITAFENFGAWSRHTGMWVRDAAQRGARLLLLPEYGAMELSSLLPFEQQNDLSASVSGLGGLLDDFLEVFATLARSLDVLIVAPSIPVFDGGKMVNRAFVLSPQGLAGFQDKLFMTRFENEAWGIAPGEAAVTLFETNWGSFGIQICYDVEFPVGAQALCSAGANLILAPSCTETIRGATRVHTGARARALENQCYVAVSQTIGDAPWSPAVDINYGYAAVYATPDKDLPEEGIVAIMEAQTPGWLVQDLDFEKISAVRADGQVFNFRDQERIGYRYEGKEISINRVIIRS